MPSAKQWQKPGRPGGNRFDRALVGLGATTDPAYFQQLTSQGFNFSPHNEVQAACGRSSAR